jgi:hypothetical protein
MERKPPIPITYRELNMLLEAGRATEAKHTKLLAILVTMCAEANTWDTDLPVSDIIDTRCGQISSLVTHDQPTRDEVYADLYELERRMFIIFKTASQVYLTEGGIELVEELLPSYPTLPPRGLTAADFEEYGSADAHQAMATIVSYCRRRGEWPSEIMLQDLLREAYDLPIALQNAHGTMAFTDRPNGDAIVKAMGEVGILLYYRILFPGDHPDTLQLSEEFTRSAEAAAKKRAKRHA